VIPTQYTSLPYFPIVLWKSLHYVLVFLPPGPSQSRITHVDNLSLIVIVTGRMQSVQCKGSSVLQEELTQERKRKGVLVLVEKKVLRPLVAVAVART
jgi:hypothetical protein